MNKKQRTALNKKKKADRPVIERSSHGVVHKGTATHESRQSIQQRRDSGNLSKKESDQTNSNMTTRFVVDE